VVKRFLYPALLTPPAVLSFSDQYAFRPTGSTTAALIALLQSISDFLATNPYVVVIGLDFSKAFDTVRQSSLLRKMALLDIPDSVYNWLVDFFCDHSHCTRFGGSVSAFQSIPPALYKGPPLVQCHL